MKPPRSMTVRQQLHDDDLAVGDDGGRVEYLQTGFPVIISFDALPDQVRAVAIEPVQVTLVAEPFDGYLYAIRNNPDGAIFEATRTQASGVER